MTPRKTPSEIAREALHQLALRKLPPTPLNYQECYNTIAGITNPSTFPEAHLRQIAQTLVAHNPEQQNQLDRLDAAIGRGSWQGIEVALSTFCKLHVPLAPPVVASIAAPDVAGSPEPQPQASDFLAKLAQMIENMLPALEGDDDQFSRQVAVLLANLRDPTVDLQHAQADLTSFSHRLSFAAEEQAEIKHSLLKLLHLIIENISKLTLDDGWLDGQIYALLTAVNPPLTLRRLDDVEHRLREVMRKQAAAKGRSLQAQEEMRRMLSAFIARLSKMNDSSASFQAKLETSARLIEHVHSIEDLAPLLGEVIGATRAMVDETSNARDQLNSLQAKVLATEAEIAKLHLELQNASASARHDPLTNVLNRKGLDESLVREIATMRRKETTLSLALLDIDNFKQLNDDLGHETGDEALIHLVGVVRENLRPQDSLARYGGEEFVILMPETQLHEAVAAMTRLQRELTRKFFLAGKDRILITFSAGVAQFAPEESSTDAMKRADQAMYLAKRAGKNRVMAG